MSENSYYKSLEQRLQGFCFAISLERCHAACYMLLPVFFKCHVENVNHNDFILFKSILIFFFIKKSIYIFHINTLKRFNFFFINLKLKQIKKTAQLQSQTFPKHKIPALYANLRSHHKSLFCASGSFSWILTRWFLYFLQISSFSPFFL